jgi:hypothetical protein
MKELLKGMFGITIGASMLPTVLGGIGSSGMAFSNATQNLVSVGFIGHTASLMKKIKW